MPKTDEQIVAERPPLAASGSAPGGARAASEEPAAADNVPRDLIHRLSTHRTVGGAPPDELAWLAAHGTVERHEPGEVLSTPSAPIRGMFVLLSGRISIHLIRAGTRHKIAEWREGDVTGLLPYSRLVVPPGDSIADESSEVLVIPRDKMQAMIRECHELTSILVHVMLDRTRFFNSTMLHDEKLKSLGKLAAGLAHELNNPAAAITRFAGTLPECLDVAESASRALGAARLTPDEAAALDDLSARCSATLTREIRSPIDEAQHEETIADWLETHGIDAGSAETIAQSPITIEALDRLAHTVRADVLESSLRWVAADCAARRLASQIEHAGTRISDLVTAVRGFTRVDATTVPQAVDIAEGLAQTLAVLRGKARAKSVSIAIDFQANLPAVRGVAAELNQIWANLIDNALDAAPASGNVAVKATSENGRVVVRVTDNGAGIPPDILDRIFDPFFTTKDVGKGTGLGLDIVRRLIDRHDGDIEVQSRPGRTEFIVSLPVAGVNEHGNNV